MSAESVRVEVLPRALGLSTSPLLQGLALASLLSLFKVCSFVRPSFSYVCSSIILIFC